MKNALNLLAILLAFAVNPVFAQEAPVLEWAVNMGGDNISQGNAVITDGDGNVYTTGWFRGTIDFDPDIKIEAKLTAVERDDIFVTKFSKDGKLIWARAMGGSGVQQAMTIDVDLEGNVYTGGFFEKECDFDPGSKPAIIQSVGNRSAFISKLDANGNYVWAKSFGEIPDWVQGNATITGLKTDANLNLYATGYFFGAVDFDPGTAEVSYQAGNSGGDCFILQLDKGANLSWAKSIGNSIAANNSFGTCSGAGIALDAQQNVYVTGSYSYTVDFDPGTKIYALTSEGNADSKSMDVFILKLNAKGDFIWANSMGGPDIGIGDYAFGIATDAKGNVYTTGSYGGTADFDPGTATFSLKSLGSTDIFVCKLTTSGIFVWAKSMGGDGAERGQSIAVDASENVYTTGYFSSKSDFDPDTKEFILTAFGDNIFVSKLGAKGEFVWAIGMGESGDHGLGIAVDKSNSILSTGYFVSAIDFDPSSGQKILSPSGGQNVYIQKLLSKQSGTTSIISQPVSDTICLGNTATFTVGSLNRTSTFQWERRPNSTQAFVTLTNNNGFSGTATSNLQVNTVENKAASGDYRAIVTSSAGVKDTSDIAKLTVAQYPGQLLTVIGDTVCVSENFALIKIPVTVKDYIYTATYTQVQGLPYSVSTTSQGTSVTLQFPVNNLGIGTKNIYLKVNNNGCETQIKDPVKVIVSEIPANFTPVNDAEICEGTDSVSISLIEPGNGYKYQAFYQGKPFPNTIIGQGFNDDIKIPAKSWTSGSYSVQVKASNLGCTITLAETANVTVAPKPIVKITTNSPVCEDSLIILQAELKDKFTYLWTNALNKYSSQNRITTLAGTIANGGGTYNLKVKGSNNCLWDSSFKITIIPKTSLSAISGKNTICLGTVNEYSVTPLTNATYNWSFKKSGKILKEKSAKISINSIDYPDSDILMVSATLNGCKTITQEADIIVNPAPRTIGSIDSVKSCSGDSLTLTAKLPRISYSWKDPKNVTYQTQSIRVLPPTVAGSYKYIVQLSQGACPGDIDTTIVTVMPKPKPGFSYGKSVFCENGADLIPLPKPVLGSNFTRTDAGKLKLTLDPFSGVISLKNSVAGTFTIKNTVTDANRCTADTSVTIVINAKPALPFIKGGCQTGTTATLSIDVSNPPLTVTWFRNRTKLANTQTINATPGAIYQALVNTAAGCFSDTAAINPFATKPEILVIKGDSTFCSGDSVILGSNSPSGNTWKNAAGATLSLAQSIVVKTSGTIFLDVNNGPCSGSDSKIVTVNTYPLAATINSNPTANSICPGKSIILFNSNTQVTKVQWVKNGVEMKDSIKSSIIVKQAGTYQIKTSNNGCNSFSAALPITVTPITVPVINYRGTQTVCQGETLNVTITNFINGQDRWYAASRAIDDNTGRSQIYPITNANVYYKVRRTLDQCFTYSADSVQIKVIPLPVITLRPSIDSICEGGKVLYTVSENTSTPNINFQWFVNEKLVSSGISKTLLLDALKETSIVKVSAFYNNLCLVPTTISKSDTIFIKQAITIKTSTLTQPTCFNKNGRIDLVPSGGKYKIIGGSLKAFQNSGLSDTVYNIIIRDTLSSCVSNASFTLAAAGKFSYQKTVGHPDCNSNNGSVMINGSGNYVITGDTIKSTSTSSLGVSKYRFTISVGNCSKRDSAILIAKPPFKLAATLVQPTCSAAGSINLTTNPQVAFTVSGTLKSASNSNLSTGAYVVKVTDPATKCFKDTIFNLVNPNAFGVRLKTHDTTLCQSTKTSLRPVFLNMPDTSLLSFSWAKKGVEVATKSTPLLVDSGKYVVTVKNKAGCFAKDSLLFHLAKSPSILSENSRRSCTGDTVIKIKNRIKLGETSTWTNLSGNTMSVIGDSIINISGLKKFPAINRIKREVSLNNCFARDTLRVYYASTIVSVDDSSITKLAGETINLKVYSNDSIAEGDKAVKFFSLRFTTSTKGILDTIINGPDIQFITDKKIGSNTLLKYVLRNSCGLPSDSGTIYLKTINKAPKYLPQLVKPNESRIYNFKVKVKDLDSNNFLQKVSVIQPPSGAKVSARIGYDPVLGDTAVFFTADYSSVPDFNGTETILLRLDDGENFPFDLSFIIDLRLDVEVGIFKVYNAVSPNGDGKNDYLHIDGFLNTDKVSVIIFNRWGDKVYSEGSYDNADKKFTGDDLPDGTYYYIVELNNGEKRDDGYLILKR